MYAEVEEYFRTTNQRERDYHRATVEATRVYEDKIQELRWKAEDEGRRYDRYDVDRAAYNEAGLAQQAAYRAAEEAKRGSGDARALLLNSEHKEVAWIAREILFNGQGSEVEGHAKTILKALPATTEQLWTIAKDDHDMCEVFDRYFSQAEAAGVFGEKDVLAAREMAALRNYVRRNWGSSYVSDLQRHLDPVIKAIKENYEAKLAEAKAEWQQLDAARAENAHHNRSEGARRAAETRRRNAEALHEDDIPALRVMAEEEAPTKAETSDTFVDLEGNLADVRITA